jgi:hypothetical protein
MPIHEAEPGVGAAVGEVAAHAKSIARLELRLAMVELKEKLSAIGIGAALLVGAAAFGLFMVAFVLATVAAALATALPVWLALLIVTVVCGGIAGALAAVGVRALRRGAPPVPRQAIEDAKLTAQAVTRNGSRHASG